MALSTKMVSTFFETWTILKVFKLNEQMTVTDLVYKLDAEHDSSGKCLPSNVFAIQIRCGSYANLGLLDDNFLENGEFAVDASDSALVSRAERLAVLIGEIDRYSYSRYPMRQ